MAVASHSQELKRQPDQIASQSDSFTGAWASLFSSFSEQPVPLQEPQTEQMQQLLAQAVNKPPMTAAAAVHQSAVFQALFEDMISMQSAEAFAAVRQPETVSGGSSAVSLCDSATSFSFKTARHTHAETQDCTREEIASAQPVALESQRLELSLDKEDLSVTLKDWQLADVQPANMSVHAVVQPHFADKPFGRSLSHSANQQAMFNGQSEVYSRSNGTQSAHLPAVIPSVLPCTAASVETCPHNRRAQPVSGGNLGKARQANKRPQRAFKGAQNAQQSACIVGLS